MLQNSSVQPGSGTTSQSNDSALSGVAWHGAVQNNSQLASMADDCKLCSSSPSQWPPAAQSQHCCLIESMPSTAARPLMSPGAGDASLCKVFGELSGRKGKHSRSSSFKHSNEHAKCSAADSCEGHAEADLAWAHRAGYYAGADSLSPEKLFAFSVSTWPCSATCDKNDSPNSLQSSSESLQGKCIMQRCYRARSER